MSTYKVVGNHAVLGNAPGSTFETGLPSEQEAVLIEGGHIVKCETPKAVDIKGNKFENIKFEKPKLLDSGRGK